jgi:hypothetical protein
MPEERVSKMPGGWWIPVLAAVVGLVGGVGGAYIGGRVANEGQQKQFENQRIAQVQDLLIANYGEFLQSAERVAADFTTAKAARTATKKAADLVEFSAAEAEIHLVGSAELWSAAQAVRESFAQSEGDYRTARDAFVERAHQDINDVAGQ